MSTRTEKDLLGEVTIDETRYYGINTARAVENFRLPTPSVNLQLIHETALIKKAAAMANHKLGLLEQEKADAIIRACEEVMEGRHEREFPVNSLQGGAGTSTNMNVNECIANRAIEILGGSKGDYSILHPLNHVNMSQSTNDVNPTALRIAAIRLIRTLADNLSDLQDELQKKEDAFAGVLKLGRTELMDALPMRGGQGFGAYAQAIARDRWRIYKSEERLRYINIGGTAIGTGLNALPKYSFLMTDYLQELTGLGLARSECPMDITQNADVFVEVSGLLKACAVNLMKISGDLRLLSSGPFGGLGEILLPEVQAGSTIMPGKVNPVIPEMIGQVAIKVMANDFAITTAAAAGQLELNAFLPLISECLLESLALLADGVKLFNEKCIQGIQMDEQKCLEHLHRSTALAAGLIHYIGYDKAAELSKKAAKEGITLREAALGESILPPETLERIFSINEITKPGIPGQ